MKTLKEISRAYKKLNDLNNKLNEVLDICPDRTSTPETLATYYSEIATNARKLAHALESYALPGDTVYHLNDEIEFAVWVRAQQA